MYQKQINHTTGQDLPCVRRLADNGFIPLDKANTDYQAYLKWLAEGNEPMAADPLDGSSRAPTEDT